MANKTREHRQELKKQIDSDLRIQTVRQTIWTGLKEKSLAKIVAGYRLAQSRKYSPFQEKFEGRIQSLADKYAQLTRECIALDGNHFIYCDPPTKDDYWYARPGDFSYSLSLAGKKYVQTYKQIFGTPVQSVTFLKTLENITQLVNLNIVEPKTLLTAWTPNIGKLVGEQTAGCNCGTCQGCRQIEPTIRAIRNSEQLRPHFDISIDYRPSKYDKRRMANYVSIQRKTVI